MPDSSGPHFSVTFFTAGSASVGLGHLRRCLALAGAFSNVGGASRFVVDATFAQSEIEKRGFDARCAPFTATSLESSDVIVVDRYDAGLEFAALAKRRCRVVVVIEDLPERQLAGDVIIDVGRARSGGVPATSEVLSGLEYALLDASFAAEAQRHIETVVGRLMVTIGATPLLDVARSLVGAARQVFEAASIDLILGPSVPAADVERLQTGSGGSLTIHRGPADMRPLMVAADVAVSGGGQTLLELAACGTPTVAIELVPNQSRQIAEMVKAGAVRCAGAVNEGDLLTTLGGALAGLVSRTHRQELSVRARAAVDGGGAMRVASAVAERLGIRMHA